MKGFPFTSNHSLLSNTDQIKAALHLLLELLDPVSDSMGWSLEGRRHLSVLETPRHLNQMGRRRGWMSSTDVGLDIQRVVGRASG